ncbi:MAG: phosphoribosylglycinamide formyltransferase [Kiritimatiellae bacterium]|nr:phosphoribosylglycinamide formyltransferase [Kiritimatiellia bacterium]
MATLKLGVLGSGAGSNMQSIVDAIEAGELDAEVRLVLSDVADAKILDRARRRSIPCRHLDCSPWKTKLEGPAEDECIRLLREAGVDTVALAGFMRIVKPGLLAAFPDRVVNIHPALLPAFPGVHGWTQALDYGCKVAGVTVHFVDAGTDTGPILVQRAVPVLEGDTPEALHARIQEQERVAYPEALRIVASGAYRIEGRRVRILRHEEL